MAIFEWRKFNFFDLNKSVDDGKVAETLKEATITCSSSGNNQIILCDSFGFVHIFQRTWEAITFKAYDDSVCLCQLSSQHNLLVTVGTDENGSISSFKVWNITKTIKTGLASLLRTVKIALQKATALAVSDNGQYMAIGFDLGSISLYRGDINRDRSKTLKTLSGGTTSITGIAFKQNEKITQMFVCSDSGVLVYNLQIKDKEPKTILDTTCEPTRCCAVSNDSHFMVGRDNAVYCYTADGRGPCYVLDGQKSIIEWFRSHLITISKSTKNTMSSSTQKDSMLTVIDIQNKFIVFTTPIDKTVAILIEFGTCFIITVDNEVYHLDEKDLQSKLILLFKKNLYDIAVRIAKNSQYDTEGLAEIFKQYGDHMYSKGDFASAVEQYTKTIGYLEPSYVIRRFLDSRHIHYLTDYLQAVHKQGQATADHTTLLLNCFTRLDRTDHLKEFLRNDKNPDIAFDLDVAIKVCRSTSVENALSLAKRNQKHDLCLSILIEDMFAYRDSLEYISNLTFLDAEENLKKYGNILMAKCPDEITELLKKLCTNYRNLSNSNINSSNNSNHFNNSHSVDILIDTNNSHVDRANPEDFIHLFVKSPERLINFLEHLITNLTNCSQLVYNTLIEHYLYQWKSDKNIETRLMEILQNNEEIYDRNHALILCSAYGFTPGIMLIYEEQKLYHLIVRYHLKNGDYNSLLDCCTRLGSSQPSLWLQTLTGLRNDKIAPTNLLSQILQVIAQEKLQSPLQVLNCLAVENGPNLLNVREYFLQVFQKENESTQQEEELVKKYRNDSITLKNHIKNLREHPIEFKSTLCNTCHQALSMPALYFLCKHSYHQDCVRGYSDNDKDCQVCHSKNLQLIDALRAQSESREQHEIFHNLLDRSSEPFTVVTEYFGRGLFNKIVIVDEDSDSLITINDTNRNSDRAMQQQTTNSQIKSITATTATTTASSTIPTTTTQHIKQINQLPSTSASSPYNVYGTGAEAKIRIDEGLSKGRSKDVINRIPIPEGRMRLSESKYSTSLEANIIRPTTSSSSLASDKSPKITPIGSPKTKNTIWLKRNAGNSAGQKVSNNPFGDDNNDDQIIVDDGYHTNENNYNIDIGYDEKKNPFADDFENDSKLNNQIKEYDNSLNPFA